jgi:MFS family permease
MIKAGPPPPRLAWSIWGLGAALFLIGFYHRVAPAVITAELMKEFDLNAAALGNLSAFYFYSYVAMQVPTGILADHWGPRRLLIWGSLITGLGTLLFALAPNITWASLGRLLIGGAVAVAYVSILKLAAHWLAPKRFALASGLALLVGVIGAVFAGVPLQLWVAAYGWRPVMLVSALIPFGLCVAIWLVVRDDPEERGYTSYMPSHHRPQAKQGFIQGLQEVLHYRNSWLLVVIPGGITGAVLTFSGLWGVPFLTSHYGLAATQAAAVSTILLVAWAVGGPCFGVMSDRLGRRKPLYIAGCAIAVLGWSLIIFVPHLPISLLVLLLLTVGFSSGCMTISYVFAKESVPPHLAGTASGLCNMGVVAGPMILQPAVGWMLDQQWQGQTVEGVRLYSLEAYQAAFSLMLAWVVLAFILIFLTRETYCRQLTLTQVATFPAEVT